jgi:glycerophosphoryl diester phosphodiesterase
LLDGLGRISHRACGLDAPENTLAALKLAVKNGANSVEFDMSFTADDVPVVFHDDTLDRTTDGTGKINLLTFKNLEK